MKKTMVITKYAGNFRDNVVGGALHLIGRKVAETGTNELAKTVSQGAVVGGFEGGAFTLSGTVVHEGLKSTIKRLSKRTYDSLENAGATLKRKGGDYLYDLALNTELFSLGILAVTVLGSVYNAATGNDPLEPIKQYPANLTELILTPLLGTTAKHSAKAIASYAKDVVVGTYDTLCDSFRAKETTQ